MFVGLITALPAAAQEEKTLPEPALLADRSPISMALKKGEEVARAPGLARVDDGRNACRSAQ